MPKLPESKIGVVNGRSDLPILTEFMQELQSHQMVGQANELLEPGQIIKLGEGENIAILCVKRQITKEEFLNYYPDLDDEDTFPYVYEVTTD